MGADSVTCDDVRAVLAALVDPSGVWIKTTRTALADPELLRRDVRAGLEAARGGKA